MPPASDRRSAWTVVFAILLGFATFFIPASARAAGCPTQPVAEHGGKHWCFDAGGSKGHVHLWTPPGFNAQGAKTVVYMHGYNNDEMSGGKRLESGSYIDRAWDNHKLAQQFAASGLNALFIAPEGPIGNKDQLTNDAKYAGVRWTSLGTLLNSVQDKGGLIPPGDVTAIGHSAGMFTVHYFFGDGRLRHVMALDSMYGDEKGAKRSAWLEKSQNNRLTLVGGNGTSAGSQNGLMLALSDKIGCTTAQGRPTSLTSSQISASCLYVNSKTEHMAVVTGGAIIPVMLARSGPSSDSGDAAVTTGATTGGSGSRSSYEPPKEYGGPTLEIPIPGVEFTGAISQDGYVTFPWLAQYIDGVYTFLLSIVGLVAAVMMMVGGFQYVTSAGDQGRLGAAKKRMTNAFVGMVLAFGSYTLLYAINPGLTSFEGLKVASVRRELTESAEEQHDGGDVIPESVPQTASGSSGRLPSKLCTSIDGCRSYCKQANCIPKLDCKEKGGKEECTVSVNCDLSLFPQSAPGIIAASEAVNAQVAFRGKTGITAAQAGDLVSTVVRDGLIRAGEIADREGYRIVMTDGFRTLPTQFLYVCRRIVKADYWTAHGREDLAKALLSKIGGGVAWPGGSLHGAGYAADLQLYKKGGGEVVCSGCCDTQGRAVYKSPSETFDKIMTEAGARRYSNEIWHYEFGAPESLQPRCKAGSCPWPPSCTK